MAPKHKTLQRADFVAVHESGHALVAWYFGLSLISISIRSQDHKETSEPISGHCSSRFSGGGWTDALTSDMFSVPRALKILAGRAATDLFLPAVPPRNSFKYDWQALSALPSLDEIALKMHAWRSANASAAPEMFYKAFKGHVLKILKTKQARRAIKTLVAELREYGTISGRAAADIFARAYGKKQPPLALPAEKHVGVEEHPGEVPFGDLMRKLAIYEKLMSEEILPNQDADHNTTKENYTINRIMSHLLYIRILVMEDQVQSSADRSP